VNGYAGMAQVLSVIEAEHCEPQSAPKKKAACDNYRVAQNISTNLLTISAG
jgi:hypothetical protein